MARFCANLSYLFTELPLLARFDAAARAGFSGVEMLAPYEASVEAIRERLDANGLSLVLINSPAGDRAGGERGTACIPGRTEEFRASVRLALDYATALGCGLVHLMGGVRPRGVDPETASALYAINLAWASERAQAAGVRLTIEAINHRDIPGYVLHTQEQAAAMIAAVGPEWVGLQFDVYHCQTAQGDVSRRLEALLPLVAHVQVADVPGRHEPGTGEVGWDYLFGRLRAFGYAGWIGCEYVPKAGTVPGLAWCNRYLDARSPMPTNPQTLVRQR